MAVSQSQQRPIKTPELRLETPPSPSSISPALLQKWGGPSEGTIGSIADSRRLQCLECLTEVSRERTLRVTCGIKKVQIRSCFVAFIRVYPGSTWLEAKRRSSTESLSARGFMKLFRVALREVLGREFRSIRVTCYCISWSLGCSSPSAYSGLVRLCEWCRPRNGYWNPRPYSSGTATLRIQQLAIQGRSEPGHEMPCPR